MRRLWVIEMLVAEDRWKPTVGCGYTRDHALGELIRLREAYPNDEFRVREYRPYGEQHE